jgi:hypothetical protein
MHSKRTLGWVQNSANTTSLKDVVKIFICNSDVNKNLREIKIPKFVSDKNDMGNFIKMLSENEMKIPYSALKGKGKNAGGTRKDAPCSGIIQATIHAQGRKEYIDDWSSDCFLRWAIALGFLNYDRETDSCSISEIGKEFAGTENSSAKEKECLGKAYLSYPPAVRVLSVLSEFGHLTKFEIGAKLGIIGEAGFTSFPQSIYLQGLSDAKSKEEKEKIIQNVEGDSDKYARMICGWLVNIGWVEKEAKIITNNGYKETITSAFRITLKGKTELKKAYGISSVKKNPKIVYWEMLATKPSDRDYLRTRRAHIIQYLNKSSEKTPAKVCEYLKAKGIIENEVTVLDDIESLKNIGLTVKKINNGYRITDIITNLNIPIFDKKIEKSDVTKIKDKIRDELKLIDHKYLNLIDLSFEGKNASRDFEVQTIELLTNELDFKGERLGEGYRPDGIIYKNSKGVIIDNKSYSKEYNLPQGEQDKMCRYIEENQKRKTSRNSTSWWNKFPKEVSNFSFLFVSSGFVKEIYRKIKQISERANTQGAAINSANLLLLAERIKDKRISYKECFELFSSNEEISILCNMNNRQGR